MAESDRPRCKPAGTTRSWIWTVVNFFAFYKGIPDCNYTKTERISLSLIESETRWPSFPDYIFKWIFLNKNACIFIQSSLKFVPKCSIDNIPGLVQIMAWYQPSNKPLSEPMMVRLLTHICVTRPQWVNSSSDYQITTTCCTCRNSTVRMP